MLNFFAPINTLGYGVFSYNLISAYADHINGEIALFPTPQCEIDTGQTRHWVLNSRHFRRSDPSIMIHQAPWLNRFSGTPMIGLPIFELDVVPEFDLRILQGLDFILQASTWGKKVLENHGLKNVHLVSGGFNPSIFYPKLTPHQKMERIQRQGIVFVHVGKFEERKSSEEILRSFLRACDDGRERVTFLFHVCNPFDPHWLAKAQKIMADHHFELTNSCYCRGNTRVVIPGERFQEEPSKLYHMADFGIWASKAEGWNLPLIECIASGRPCITTDNTAQGDFIRKDVYPSELIIKSNQKEPTRQGMPWWPVDEEELTQKIRRIIQDPMKFASLESPCRESIRPFTWKNSSQQLDEFLKTLK